MTDQTNLSPRLLTRPDAAAYCHVSVATFSAWVSMGLLPGPVFQSKRWDREAIDAALDRESGIERGKPEPEDPLQKWLRESKSGPPNDRWRRT